MFIFKTNNKVNFDIFTATYNMAYRKFLGLYIYLLCLPHFIHRFKAVRMNEKLFPVYDINNKVVRV